MAKETKKHESRPLPLSTPISKFGLPERFLKELTPTARSLTKRDLFDLNSEKLTPATRKLTVEDVSSLRKVFGRQNAMRAIRTKPKNGNGGTGCCCCCCSYFCCCCTAVAVTKSRISSTQSLVDHHLVAHTSFWPAHKGIR